LRRILMLGVAVALTGVWGLACDSGDDDDSQPPSPTANNTLDSAWNVNLPYSGEFEVPGDDPAEVFHFGIGSSQTFGAVIVIKLKLLEPVAGGFRLDAELLSEQETLLVSSQNSDLLPTAWVASRPNQTYYLRIRPVGDPGERYRYSLEIASSSLNDPFEEDNDTSQATALMLGIDYAAYLCSPFSDSLTDAPMASLPDFYSIELLDTACVYVTVEKLGGDCKPLLRLYRPDGEVFAEVEDTAASFDLAAGFQAGRWYLEVTDARGSYPQYGDGDVAFNYLSPYLLRVTDNPQ